VSGAVEAIGPSNDRGRGQVDISEVADIGDAPVARSRVHWARSGCRPPIDAAPRNRH
jgi:hypothetical protein